MFGLTQHFLPFLEACGLLAEAGAAFRSRCAASRRVFVGYDKAISVYLHWLDGGDDRLRGRICSLAMHRLVYTARCCSQYCAIATIACNAATH